MIRARDLPRGTFEHDLAPGAADAMVAMMVTLSRVRAEDRPSVLALLSLLATSDDGRCVDARRKLGMES